MKQAKFFIFLLIFFTANRAFSQEYEAATPVANPNITPITLEHVNLIRNSGRNFNELNYYLSKPFTLVISELYDAPRVEIQNGALIMADGNQAEAIIFNGSQQGRLHGFPVFGSDDIFEVIFQTERGDVALKFKKDGNNCFELFSALINTRPYALHSDSELPKLAINSNINLNLNISSGGGNGLVEGKGSLEKGKITAHIKNQNPALDDNFIDALITAYIQEAAFENINHDIAVAQMLFATNYLKNYQLASSHNYAGLYELPNWDGNFSDMTEGVRAHIQHIKGYASTSMNNPQIVDPRYYLLINLKYLGTVKTFDQLYERWTANPATYKKNIETILESLYK